MSIAPLPRYNKTNWLNLHNKHYNDILSTNYKTLLIGDSLIAGLSRYPNIWKKYFIPLNALNCGIGGDKIENVLWRTNNLPTSRSIQNTIILCGTNNIQRNSTEDIVDGISDIIQSLQRKYVHSNIIVCGLLPRDEIWSVNRIYIDEINESLFHKCDLHNVKFIKPKDWTFHNGFLKSNLFYSDNLHLIEEGNIKLSESIVNVIKPNNEALTISTTTSQLFKRAADFSFNDSEFPPLPCSKPVFRNVCISKPVCKPIVRNSFSPTCKPVVRKSVSSVCKPVVHSKPVSSVRKPVHQKPVSSVCKPVVRKSTPPICKPVSSVCKPVYHKPVSSVCKPAHHKPVSSVCKPVIHSSHSKPVSSVRKPVLRKNVSPVRKPDVRKPVSPVCSKSVDSKSVLPSCCHWIFLIILSCVFSVSIVISVLDTIFYDILTLNIIFTIHMAFLTINKFFKCKYIFCNNIILQVIL